MQEATPIEPSIWSKIIWFGFSSCILAFYGLINIHILASCQTKLVDIQPNSNDTKEPSDTKICEEFTRNRTLLEDKNKMKIVLYSLLANTEKRNNSCLRKKNKKLFPQLNLMHTAEEIHVPRKIQMQRSNNFKTEKKKTKWETLHIRFLVLFPFSGHCKFIQRGEKLNRCMITASFY